MCNIKKIKSIGKKFILAGSLVGMLLTPISKIDVKAYDENNQSYYEIDNENGTLELNDINDLNFLNNGTYYNEIIISNSKINSSINLENANISSLKLVNCKFASSNIVFPKSLLSLELESSTLGNYDSIKNSNIENLSFTNSNFNNLYMLPNSLTQLGIYNCKLPKLTGIENCKNLTNLVIENTDTVSINEISSLKKLDSLFLRFLFIKDLSPIKNLNISCLDVSNSTRIENLDCAINNNLTLLFAENCEMAYTNNLVKYVNDNNIQTNISEDGLIYKNKVLEIAKNITNDKMTNEEKIKSIVNYVIDNIEYDERFYTDQDYACQLNNNGLKYALSGYGCCKNYTSLTTALLRACNIDSYDVKNETHIWNLVNVDNQYYWLDTTYIDYNNENLETSENYMTQSKDFIDSHYASNIPNQNYDYNKIENSNNININANDLNSEKEKFDIVQLLKEKKANIAAVIGILCAFNIAVPLSKKYINNKKKSNEKTR